MKSQLIEKLNQTQLKKKVPDFAIGDTISVHIRIIEGEKERVQIFTGTVIARKGEGLSETFSLYKVAFGESIERVFLLHSPKIAKIEINKKGQVRRSKLYYLRGTSGKAAKVASKNATEQERTAETDSASAQGAYAAESTGNVTA